MATLDRPPSTADVVRHLASLLLVLAALLPVRNASAQTCLGSASFGAGLVRAGATLASSDAAKVYGGAVAVGAPTGPFVDASLAWADYEGASELATIYSIGVGYAIEVTPAAHVQFCPRIAHRRQSRLSIETSSGMASTELRVSEIGASLGGLVSVTPRLDVVPFAGAAYLATRTTRDFEQGASEADTEDDGQLQLGAGLVLDRRITLQPAVLIPLGSDGGSSTFQLLLAWTFGPAHR